MSQQNDENIETTTVDVEEQVETAEEQAQAAEEVPVEEALKAQLAAAQAETAERKDQT